MIMTLEGHVGIAESLFKEKFYMMWGNLPSDVAEEWTQNGTPSEDITSTQLIKPVGVLLSTIKQYVNPDDAGDIVTSDSGGIEERRWSYSTVPTRHIYLQFKFLQNYNPTDIIYQLGVFLNTTFTDNPNDNYHTAGSIDNPGKMMYLENLQRSIVRSLANREVFEFVLTF